MAEAAAAVFDAVAERRRASRRQALAIGAVVVGVAAWSAIGAEVSIANLVRGMPAFFDLLGRMLPPDLGILGRLVEPMIATLQMALIGTTLPIFFARYRAAGAYLPARRRTRR